MSDDPLDNPSPLAPHASTPQELKARNDAERTGKPHLVYRDEHGHQVLRMLDGGDGSLAIGRRGELDILLDWDPRVSRLHARLEAVGSDWTVVDNGSTNGSFLNGERLQGPHLLRHGDQLLVGRTVIVFLSPTSTRGYTTTPAGDTLIRRDITEADRRVLVALCRPYKDFGQAVPATNKVIAAELAYSVPTVKKRLSALFVRFGLENEPQAVKRTRLAVIALSTGIVRQRDL
jgi:pSer/pThr/pTyr-binding forkhead associated (FHA) protein